MRCFTVTSRHWVSANFNRFFGVDMEGNIGNKKRERNPPGAWIEARLPLRTYQGRYLLYRATVRADDAGRYAIRLPYANRGGPPATRTHAYYTLYCHAGSARAVIEEEHVRRGAEVPGPDLCL